MPGAHGVPGHHDPPSGQQIGAVSRRVPGRVQRHRGAGQVQRTVGGEGLGTATATFAVPPFRSARTAHGTTPGRQAFAATCPTDTWSRKSRRACGTSSGCIRTGTP